MSTPATPRLRLLLADDEPLARDRARRLLERIGSVEVIGEAPDGRAALALIEQLQPDVVLLDIHMPELDGLRVLEALDDPPAVIFATAHEAHAVRAFELEATDYLLKPYSADRLARALERVHRQFALQGTAPNAPPSRIPVEDGPRKLLLLPGEIDAASIEEGVVFVLREDAERYCFAGTLQELEAQLPENSFFRVSRQGIVQLEAIRSIAPLEDGRLELRLRSRATVEVSRRRARHLRARWKRPSQGG